MAFEPTTFVGKVRTLQIVVIALVAGAGMYLGFVVIQEQPPVVAEADDSGDVMRTTLTLAALAVVLHRLAPWFVMKQTRRALTSERTVVGEALEDRLLMARQTATIVGAAICESASFANSYAYISQHHLVSLGASALMIVLALSFFPTVDGMQRRLEREVRAIEELRQFG